VAAALARPMSEVLTAPSLALSTPPDIAVGVAQLLPPKQKPAADGSPFHKLLVELHRARLVFPPELIANFLLALQVKRFVILTGISGTGKTQIVQKIAAQFPVMTRVPIVDVDRQMDCPTLKPYSTGYRPEGRPAGWTRGSRRHRHRMHIARSGPCPRRSRWSRRPPALADLAGRQSAPPRPAPLAGWRASPPNSCGPG